MSTRRRRAPRPPPGAPGGHAACPPADQRSHEQAQVEGARVDEQSFEDVGVPAQMRPPHASGLVELGVGAFEAFATLALQGSAPCAADAAAIGVHRVSRRGRARPAPSAALGFGNVRAQIQRRQIHQDLVAVVPLVGDDFLFQSARQNGPFNHGLLAT